MGIVTMELWPEVEGIIQVLINQNVGANPNVASVGWG